MACSIACRVASVSIPVGSCQNIQSSDASKESYPGYVLGFIILHSILVEHLFDIDISFRGRLVQKIGAVGSMQPIVFVLCIGTNPTVTPLLPDAALFYGIRYARMTKVNSSINDGYSDSAWSFVSRLGAAIGDETRVRLVECFKTCPKLLGPFGFETVSKKFILLEIGRKLTSKIQLLRYCRIIVYWNDSALRILSPQQ